MSPVQAGAQQGAASRLRHPASNAALAVFTLLAWLATGAFAVVYTFPSRRYLLAQAATIATA
jgi:hypothetical protein